MLDAVAPVLDEVRLEDLVFLRGDGVGHLSRVGHGDFLVPAFLAHLALAAEGIEAREGDAEVGQGEEARMFCVRLPESESESPRSWKVWL